MQIGDEITAYRFGPHNPKALKQVKIVGFEHGFIRVVSWIKSRKQWSKNSHLMTHMDVAR